MPILGPGTPGDDPTSPNQPEPQGPDKEPSTSGIPPPPNASGFNTTGVSTFGYTVWPALEEGMKVQRRSSDITGVLNGFFSAMDSLLPHYIKLDGLSLRQQPVDMNDHKIVNLANAQNESDVVPLGQLQAVAP